ncbi:MAG: dihydrodipicolinate synthase family protein [Acidobacteriota bacterium]
MSNRISGPPTRRSFLRVSGAGLAASGLAVAGLRSEPTGKRAAAPQDFRRRLAGPIQSQPTPFNEKREIDHAAVRRMAERALRYGVPVFALTAGNSQYHSLSYEEVKALTRTLVEAVDGRGLTIAATGQWWTERAVDYARYSESVGADAVQILMPAVYGSEDELVEHYRVISRATRLPLVLHGQYPEPLLRKLLEIESIVAMKEDGQLADYIDRAIEFGKRVEIFGGGAENRYLVGHPYGAKAFYSTYCSFAPDIPMRFWQAVKANDLRKATEITARYDYPFIKRFTHPFWHATLEFFGVARRYMRPPQHTFTDEQMKEVAEFFEAQGVRPADYKE